MISKSIWEEEKDKRRKKARQRYQNFTEEEKEKKTSILPETLPECPVVYF